MGQRVRESDVGKDREMREKQFKREIMLKAMSYN